MSNETISNLDLKAIYLETGQVIFTVFFLNIA